MGARVPAEYAVQPWPTTAAVERELFEVGRKLAAALPTTRNPLKVLDDKAMDLASSDAELKAALFRFVDVVPACRNLDDLARHLTAFLEDVGRAAAARGRGVEDGQLQGRAPRAGDGGRVGRQAHGAPLHRRRGPEGGARRPARPLEGRRGVVGRPAGRGDGHAGRGAALRRPLRRRAGHDRARRVGVAGARAARARLGGRAAAGEPVGEGERADAAAAAGRARARQARRRRPAAAAAAAGATSAARTCTSTWSRWTRATRCWS